MEAIEALSHPRKAVRRLFELAVRRPDGLDELEPRSGRACRTTPRPLDAVVVDELVQAYRDGVGVKQLARLFGVHRHTVSKHLRDHGIDTREPKLSTSEIQEAAQLYSEGWSLARLGKRFGVDDGTVRSRLLEVGVVMRPRRGGRQKAQQNRA